MEIFPAISSPHTSTINMKILILNWKDIKNPAAGGAEILTHEMAKGFIAKGHKVIMFVSAFPQSRKKETIDGITIIRAGKLDLRALSQSVHYKAYRYYKKNLQGQIDVIIDEVHGLPFFASFYAKEKVVALICEVAGDIWFRMFAFPWNSIGWLAERCYLIAYRNVPVLTISDSTKKELIVCGIPQNNITVLPMGITRVPITGVTKEKKPTLIFVGRLNKMKGIEDAIRAVAQAKKTIPDLQFWIVGKGEEDFMQALNHLVQKEGIDASTKFWKYVSQQKKFELMAKSHAIVVPSVREGFGLIVPEAGSVGTPAVVYDVHGLRDTVKQGVNGIKVALSVAALSKGIEKILTEKKQYKALCLGAKKESNRYQWENTAKVALDVI